MMTMLFEPFAPLFGLSRELNRLAPSDTQFRSFIPAADVLVTDDEVTVVMDVPGFKGDDLQIELVDNVLTVRGERAFPHDTENSDKRVWQRLERGFGKFERVLQVPEGLDADGIKADIADGILTLQLPVTARKPRKIQITAGTSQPLEQSTTPNESNKEERELAGSAA